MNMAELTSYMYEASLENPIIDLDISFEETSPAASSQGKKKKHRESERIYAQKNAFDWMTDPAQESFFLQHSLLEQLPKGASASIRQVFRYLIFLLDDRGYLPADTLSLLSDLRISPDEAAEAMKLLQAMTPAGIGATNLRHCLLLQLEQEPKRDELAITLVQDFLPQISERKYGKIAKDLNLSKEKILRAIEHIQKLNPIPANGYTNPEKIKYIVPDITATTENGKILLHFNQQYLPALKQSTPYLQMLESSSDQQLKDYLQKKLQEFKTLQAAIAQREHTLVLIVSEITKAQSAFFLNAQTDSQLRPLSLADLAQRTGLSVSTISRALQDKYIQLEYTVYPLKYFLVRSISAENTVSSRIGVKEVKARISELIQKEDKSNPLSDQANADILNSQGIRLSRRGVSKYRQELSIPSMFERKIF